MITSKWLLFKKPGQYSADTSGQYFRPLLPADTPSRYFRPILPAATSGRYFRPILLADTSGRYFRPILPADTSGRYFRPILPANTSGRYFRPILPADTSSNTLVITFVIYSNCSPNLFFPEDESDPKNRLQLQLMAVKKYMTTHIFTCLWNLL